jgi:hypothetical protein
MLVSKYFESAGWQGIEQVTSAPRAHDPLYAVVAMSPSR